MDAESARGLAARLPRVGHRLPRLHPGRGLAGLLGGPHQPGAGPDHAATDVLTGLGDRPALARHADRPETGPAAHALLVLDLDGFKAVNDMAGHEAGDAVLREVARRVADVAGDDGVAVRLGGDEFALLSGPLTGPPAEAAAAAEELASRVEASIARPVRTQGVDLSVRASVGVALHRRDGHGLEQLLRAADQAMYAAKAARGRPPGGVRLPDLPDVPEEVLAADLARAVDEGGLELHYQPQVTWSGAISGVEALLRWPHPRLGVLAPRQVLPLAQRHGLTTRLALWTIERALADRRLLAADLGVEVVVSVNIAARDLLGHAFVPDIARLLQADAAGAPPGPRLTLEIGEPSPHPVPQVVSLFEGLADLGVAVSIHELGLGQVSLAAISRYPAVRELKIDPLLVRQVADDEATARLVRAIVGAAHGLEVEVVAEGVEDHRTVRRLRELGCDRLQGFAVAAPTDLAALRAWAVRWPDVQAQVLGPTVPVPPVPPAPPR
ncbi:EAL domain-containing protein [Nocardioides salarius]|uniref:EAL domain-containing protein n=1 Tax=Nocardioides salarius TaxID=374513 RepID=UPI0030F9D28B